MNSRTRTGKIRFGYVLLIAVIAILVGVFGGSPAQAQTKYVFAHYMVTNQDYSSTYTDSTAVFPALGNDKVAKYKQEILEAQADGFDGFALNCGGWFNTSGNNYYYIWYSEQIFQAAYELNTGFKLFFSCDTCCGNQINDAEDMVRRFANDPHWGQVYFKYNNKVVLSFFDGSGFGASGMAQIKSDLANGTNPQSPPPGYAAASTAPLSVFIIPSPFWGGEVPQLSSYQSQESSWTSAIDGTFYWGIAGVPGSGGTPANPGEDLIIANENVANVDHGNGKVYMAPVCFHFWGANAGRYYDYSGYEGYRKYWLDNINVAHPEMIECITWNDFMEGSYVSPLDDNGKYPLANFIVGSGVDTWRSADGPPLQYWHKHAAVGDMTKYYIQWYKSGVQPAINSDQIFWSYRSQPIAANAGTPNIGTIHGPFSDTIYVTCNLAAAATLTVNSAGTITTINVPAGISDQRAPCSAGAAPTFTLTRGGTTIYSGAGDSPIMSSPIFNTNSTTVGLGDGQPHTHAYNDLYMVTGDSPSIPFNQAPNAPSNLTATVPAAGAAVDLTWTASVGTPTITYHIYRGTAAGGESGTELANTTSTSYHDGTAANGTHYFYIVKATNSLGTSGASNEANATPVAPTAASVPVLVSASGSQKSVNLSWNASTGTSPITYNVLRGTSSGGETVIKTGLTGTTYTDAGLSDGTTYYYKVAAVNIVGTSANSNELSAKTLVAVYQINCGGSAAAPYVADEFFDTGTSFSAANTIDTSAVANPAPTAVYQAVRWNATMNYTIPGLTAGASYLVRLHFVELSFTVAGSRKFNVAINGTNVLSAFDVFAAAGGQNKAIVKEFTATANASGQVVVNFTTGGADNPDIAGIEVYGGGTAQTTPPSAPTLTGTAANAQTTLTWTTSTGNPTPTYNVLRGTTSGGETLLQSGVTSPFNNTGLTNGTTYFYKIQAVNSAGTATSNEFSLTPNVSLPGTPTLSGTAGNTQVTLNWTAASGASTYNVYQNGTLKTSGLTGLTTNVTGLTNGTTYNFTVAAVNTAGTGTPSNSVPLTPNVSLPGSTTLSGTAGNTQVTLNWTASSGATSYNIYQNGTLKTNTGNTNLTANVTGLTNGTAYTFTVAGVNSAGTGSQSNSVPLTPVAGSSMLLGIACGNSAVAPYVADVDFSGGAVSSGTTTAISTTGITNPAPQSVYQHARKGTCTYTIPGLTAGGSYTVRLHFAEYAHTGTGQRQFNVSINGTQVLTNFDIFAAAGGEFKANVQQFSATANGSGQIVIAFTTVLDNVLINGIEIDGAGGGNTAPSAPTLTLTPGNTTMGLSWTTSTGTPAPTYTIMRGTTAGNETTTVASNQTGTTFNDTGLTNGTTYFYVVKAINSVGTATSAEKSAAPAGIAGIDLIVTSISWTPTTLASGSHVVFSCVVKNQGSVATTAGMIVGAQFAVDGVTTPITWSDTNTASLAPGASVTLTANNGTNSQNYWTAVSGSHTVQAWVDDVNRIAESNETNNKTTAPITVP